MPREVDFDPFAEQAPKRQGKPVDFDPFASAAPQPSGPKAELFGKNYQADPEYSRQLGLTARMGINALTGIPQIVGDAANAATNYGIRGINALTGAKIPELTTVTEAVNAQMNRLGIPEPKTPAEKLAQIAGGALGGAGLAKGLAGAVPQGSQAAAILAELGRGPALQAAGAAAGGAGVMAAEKAGVENPLALAAIGMTAGVIPGVGATAVGRTAGAAAQLARPFTQAGREIVVGKTLNRLATNPTAAASNLENAAEIVPGSRPTVTQVSRDPGLIRAESALPDDRGVIAARKSEQNTARMRELDRIAGDDSTLLAATDKRGRTFSERAEPAFANAQPVQMGNAWINNPVLRKIQEIRETPAGARQTVRDALDEAQSLITQEGVDTSDVRVLYEIRKDLALLRDGELSGPGKSGAERSNLKNAKREFNEVIKAVDSVIELGAPGYREYMQLFAKRSIPVDQLKALQSLREKAVLAAPDPVTGQPILSQAKFTNLLRNNIAANPDYNGVGPGVATMRATVPGTQERVLAKLSSQQINTLDRIAADLDRSVADQASTMKAPGSDTFKNLSVASVIGRILGDQAGALAAENSAVKTAVRPLSYLYRVPDEQIQMLLLDAWTDPRLAARFMRQATQHEIDSVAAELRDRLSKQLTAEALYNQE